MTGFDHAVSGLEPSAASSARPAMVVLVAGINLSEVAELTEEVLATSTSEPRSLQGVTGCMICQGTSLMSSHLPYTLLASK